MSARSVTVLAVDGNSLGHRAFHSLGGAAGDAHTMVGAVVSMLASAWRHGPYAGVLVAFDHPVNRRRDDWPEYKANRSSDPGIAPALDRLRDDLGTVGIPVVREHGAEADDLLAAAADEVGTLGWRVDLLSSDRDLIALVDHHVRLLRPRQTFADLVVEDPDRVRADHGIEPRQYHDLAALRGDTSDGLGGVSGIGPAIAARLLREHGDVEGLYAALVDLPPRIESALRAARADVERNLLLMAPLPHLHVDVRPCVEVWDPQRVRDQLAELGEETAARRLWRAVTEPLPPVAPPPPVPPTEDRDHEAEPGHTPRSPRRGEPVSPDPATVSQEALFDA